MIYLSEDTKRPMFEAVRCARAEKSQNVCSTEHVAAERIRYRVSRSQDNDRDDNNSDRESETVSRSNKDGIRYPG